MLFPKALFLVTDFPKIVKNAVCLLNFHQKLSIFSQNFQQIVFSAKTREKLTHGSLNLLKNKLKYSIFAFFLRNFLKIFENFPAPRGLPPLTPPPRGRPTRVFTLNQNPGYPTGRISICILSMLNVCTLILVCIYEYIQAS